jgi:hypothetical protein
MPHSLGKAINSVPSFSEPTKELAPYFAGFRIKVTWIFDLAGKFPKFRNSNVGWSPGITGYEELRRTV